MKRKRDLEDMYERIRIAAPRAGSTLRTIEAYTALKTVRWALDLDHTAVSGLEELVQAIESGHVGPIPDKAELAPAEA